MFNRPRTTNAIPRAAADDAFQSTRSASLYTADLTRLAKYTVDLYTNLEKETGQATGFVQPGNFSIATNKERWEEFLRGAAMLRGFEVIAEAITPKEVQQKWPLLNVDDVIGAIWYPKDGKCNPADVTMCDGQESALHRPRGSSSGEGEEADEAPGPVRA
jgi:glycine/D-amino acid oxidase-like deaminating enzyme